MVMKARIILALLLLAAPVGAQAVFAQTVLPDKPAPKGNFFTRPFYDKKIAILAEINAGAATWDDVSSRRVLDLGGYERDPLMRPFVRNSGALAAETVGEVWLVAFVADRMKHSHIAILRKAWWVPQAVDISAKVVGGINNMVILGR
jgi:hypothetical protein